MSFSASAKDELSKIIVSDLSVMTAEIAAFLRMCGTIRFQSSMELGLHFSTENASVARRLVTFIKRLYTEEVELMATKNRQLKKRNQYQIHLKDPYSVLTLLSDSNFMSLENVFSPNYVLNPQLIRNQETLAGYIRASFLGSGSITNPDRAYHLEFICSNEEHGKDLMYWLKKAGFDSKGIPRKDDFIVYMKEGESISDLLAYMGASQSVLHFESVRVMKDVRNGVNRLVNCETANLAKTIEASMRQIEDITIIKETIGLSALEEDLQKIAEYRMENPEASLLEIGESFSPPMSKSGVNRRLKKLRDQADRLRGE